LPNSERIPRRNDHIANLNILTISHGNRGEICGGHFEDRDVGGRIASNDFGGGLALAVGQANLNFVSAFDYVIIAEDVTISGHNYARAEALLLAHAGMAGGWLVVFIHAEEAAEERIVEERVA